MARLNTEAKAMKPASIKQNSKRRMRKLITVLLPTMSRVALHEPRSSSFLMKFAGCNLDAKI